MHRVGREVDEHRVLDAPRRDISCRIVSRDPVGVSPIGYSAEGEGGRRDVGLAPLVLFGGAVGYLVPGDADVVVGRAPSEHGPRGTPFGADFLDLIRRQGIDGDEVDRRAQVAVNGGVVVARHQKIEGVTSPRQVVGGGIVEDARRFGGGKFRQKRARLSGRIPGGAEDRDGRVFHQ